MLPLPLRPSPGHQPGPTLPPMGQAPGQRWVPGNPGPWHKLGDQWVPRGRAGPGWAGKGREMVRTEGSGQDASPETERARFPEANTSTCPDPGMGVPALRSLHPQDQDPGPPPCPALRQALLLYRRVRGAEGQVGGSGRSEPACPSHIPETCPALSPLTAPTHPSSLSSGPAPAPRP